MKKLLIAFVMFSSCGFLDDPVPAEPCSDESFIVCIETSSSKGYCYDEAIPDAPVSHYDCITACVAVTDNVCEVYQHEHYQP